MEWEVAISGAEHSDEMVFEGANGTFSCVAAMVIRWSELKIDVVLGKVVFEKFGALVVQTLELRCQSGGLELVANLFEGRDDVFGFAGSKGFCEYAVAVVVVGDKDVLVAIAGWNRELAS